MRSSVIGIGWGALIVLFLIVPAHLACAAPATTPSAAAQDEDTQNALQALERGQPEAPATAPATSGAAPASDESAQSPPRYSMGQLVSLFHNLIVTDAALGIAGGIVGVFVLLRREALVALAVPQVVAVGAAIGMRLEWPTLPPALGLALVALVYFALSRRWAASNWIVPSFYIAGLCLSFLVIANHGQDVEDLQHLFVGVDVAISGEKAAVATPILLAVAIGCALLWRRWLLLAQAPAAAELAGLRPARWDTLFLALLTIVILLGTYAVTVVMVLAMLFLPAAAVLPWARRLPAAMAASALLSLVFVATGFVLSNKMQWPMSQTVGGVGFAALGVSQLAHKLR